MNRCTCALHVSTHANSGAAHGRSKLLWWCVFVNTNHPLIRSRANEGIVAPPRETGRLQIVVYFSASEEGGGEQQL